METPTISIDELQEKYKETQAARLELTRQVNERAIYTENPYSFNIYLRHPSFGKGQFTIRTRPGEDGEAFMWRINGMLKKAEKMGWAPEGAPVSIIRRAAAPGRIPYKRAISHTTSWCCSSSWMGFRAPVFGLFVRSFIGFLILSFYGSIIQRNVYNVNSQYHE